uniref:Serpin family G member 1 n=1 Tax=Oryctolagus cuniculus TaxID=9986 RepID=G1SCJ8_RABIT
MAKTGPPHPTLSDPVGLSTQSAGNCPVTRSSEQVAADVAAQMASRLTPLTLLLLLLAGDGTFSNPGASSPSPRDPESLQKKSTVNIWEEDSPTNPSTQHIMESSTWPVTNSATERAEDTTNEPSAQPFSQHTQPTTLLPTDFLTEPTADPYCPEPDTFCSDSDCQPIAEGLGNALVDFSLRLYQAFSATKKPETNLAFSPFSIASLLTQVLLGAGGSTRKNLEDVLSYPEDTPCVFEALKAITSKGVTSVSQIFHSPGECPGRDSEAKEGKKALASLSGSNRSWSILMVRPWASHEHSSTPFIFYLKFLSCVLLGCWKFSIQHFLKIIFPFHFPMSVMKYPWIRRVEKNRAGVARVTGAPLVLQVGQLQLSHNLSFVILMPQSLKHPLEDIEKALSPAVLKAVMKKLELSKFQPTFLMMPRIKVKSNQDMLSIMEKLEFFDFSYDLNLCKLTDDPDLLVSTMQHQTVLELTETGVEAAAATGVSVARSLLIFEVQQPFLFLLWDQQHKVPVFMGRVYDPRD